MFGSKKKKMEQAQNLMATGGRAVGTLVDVVDTGMTINDMQIRVKLRLRIEPIDGSTAFDGEKTMFVNRVNVPPRGARYPVFYDRNDPTQFALVESISDDNGRQTIIQMFGDKFGPDASGIGMPAVAAAPAAAPAAEDPLDRLKKLADLHSAGVLTDAEFAQQKAEILNG